jgi:hypothetical protein
MPATRLWRGTQGRTVNGTPYWKLMIDWVLSNLPAQDAEFGAAGLEGLYFPSTGRHEVLYAVRRQIQRQF